MGRPLLAAVMRELGYILPAEAGAFLSTSKTTIQRAIKEGKLDVLRVERRNGRYLTFVTVDSLIEHFSNGTEDGQRFVIAQLHAVPIQSQLLRPAGSLPPTLLPRIRKCRWCCQAEG